MINLRIKNTALLLPVRVTPKSSFNRVMPYKLTDEWVQVKVTALPEDGKANKAVIETLSKAIGLAKRDIQLVSGETSRLKTFALEGNPSFEALLLRLAKVMETDVQNAFSEL